MSILGKIETAAWSYYHYKADATKVANELLALPENFDAKDVVDYARDESTELHKVFTWDDTEAAEKYREHQARMMISNLKITYVKPDKPEEPQTIRMFYSTDGAGTKGKTGMKRIDVIVKDEDEYAKLLECAIRELESFRNKYKSLSELSEIFKLIDEL